MSLSDDLSPTPTSTTEAACETEAPLPQGDEIFGEDAEARYQALHDQYLRLAADFENFRKRTQQDRETLLKYGAENTIQSLLPVLDNLERANSSLSEQSDPKMLFQSFTMLSRQLLEALSSLGLKKIETVGQPFDPKFHEATAQVETDEIPEDQITAEQQCGFLLHDRVIRPARVVVATPKPCEPPPPLAGEENPFAKTE